jgi:hypothetical protein
MNKKSNFFVYAVAGLVLVILLLGCQEFRKVGPVESQRGESLAGTYVGYFWRGEVDGVPFEETDQYIETILTLDDGGTIVNAKINSFVLVDGYWTMRQSGNATVVVDYSVDPVPAVPGTNYEPGISMFTICTVDKMSFYTVGVNESGIAALAIVDPITRYQFEMKFPEGFDYDRTMGEFPISSRYNVPTIRTSASGYLRPESWDEVDERTIFDVDPAWSHVVNSYGILKGIDHQSTVRAFLEALGVEFDGDAPSPMENTYGYFGNGGWHGNARAIEASLIGQNATEKTSLVDWSISRYAGAINEQNQFGVDVTTGATRTVQDSIDGISGATVRMSREATSYQRALVEAGILEEEDVIIGRF